MEFRLISEGKLRQCRLAELLTGSRYVEAAPLEVTDGHAGSVCVNKVSDLPAAVGQDGCFIFAIEKLAVDNEKTSGDSVAEGLRLQVLQLAESGGVGVG